MDANLSGTLWQHCPLVQILPGNASLSSSYSMVHSSKMRKSLWKVRISAFGTIWSPGFLITMHLSVCPLPALAAFLWLGTPRSSRRWPCATSLLARATGPAAGLHCRLGNHYGNVVVARGQQEHNVHRFTFRMGLSKPAAFSRSFAFSTMTNA